MKKFIFRFYPIGIAIGVITLFIFGSVQASQITPPASASTVNITSSTNAFFTTVTSTNAIFNLLTLFGYTPCSVLFAGPAGLVTQNNAKLCWDNSNFILNVTGTVKTTDFQLTTSGGLGKVLVSNASGVGTWSNSISNLGGGSATTTNTFQNYGFSTFGESDLPVKEIYVQTTSSASTGGSVQYTFSTVSSTDVVGLDAMINWSGSINGWMPPFYGGLSGGYYFSAYTGDDGSGHARIFIENGASASNITSKAVRIHLKYTNIY